MDEKADQLIRAPRGRQTIDGLRPAQQSDSLCSAVRLMKLEKEVEADEAVKGLLSDMKGRATKEMMKKQAQQQLKKKKQS